MSSSSGAVNTPHIALMLGRGVISTKDEVLQIIDRLNGSVASPASAPAAQAAPVVAAPAPAPRPRRSLPPWSSPSARNPAVSPARRTPSRPLPLPSLPPRRRSLSASPAASPARRTLPQRQPRLLHRARPCALFRPPPRPRLSAIRRALVIQDGRVVTAREMGQQPFVPSSRVHQAKLHHLPRGWSPAEDAEGSAISARGLRDDP